MLLVDDVVALKIFEPLTDANGELVEA